MKKLLLMICVAPLLGGCSEDEKPSGMRARQDAALRDPFGYDPHDDRTDISGGGGLDFKKDAFKKDVDSVFSP